MTTPPVLSKVHTFAQDLERVRGSREDGGMRAPAAAPQTTTPSQPTPATTSSTPAASQPAAPIKLSAGAGRDASYPATIITDKKRRTFNLTEEVSTAVSDWWNEKVKTVKGGRKPTYSVPAVERRKGVVQTATTQTGRIATSDHREIVTKLKQDSTKPFSLEQSAVLPVLKKNPVASPVPPSFDATQPERQVGYGAEVAEPEPAITAAATEIVMPEEPVAAAATPMTEPPVVQSTPRIEPTMPPTLSHTAPEPTETFETEVYEEAPAPAPVVVTPLSFPKITPVAPTPVVTPVSSPRENAFSLLAEVPKPTFPITSSEVKDTIASRMKERAPEPLPASNRLAQLRNLAPYLAGVLFITITVGGIAYFMMMGTTTPPVENLATDLPTTAPTGDFPTGTYVPASVTSQLDAPNKASLFAAIKGTAGLGDGLFIVTPLSHDAAFPLGTREILGLINRQLAPDFVGNINNIQLGMYRNEPVILLSISDENSARGGMFRWETTISQDLSPWFGQGLRLTNTNNVTNFIDGASAGRDVRILKDDIGTERITYGFINQNVLLITTNATAFLNIADSYTNN